VAVAEATPASPHGAFLATHFRRTRDLAREIRENRTALAGFLILSAIAVLLVLAPWIARYPPNRIDVLSISQGPSWAHWFGTDDLGRDQWARILYGGRVSVPSGLEAVAISIAIGTPLGVFAGYVGGIVDDAIMRLMDVFLAFPGILLAIGVIAVMGPGLQPAVIGLGIGGIPLYARVGRGSALSVRELDYVAAAKSQGAGRIRILRKHIVPNVIDPLIVLATLNVGGAILSISALSFLGLGTQLPDADWGTMLTFGYQHMFDNTGAVAVPGLAILVTVLGINLFGDGIGDALDPRR
jgi:peptide/nickel transport system permease protein